MVFISSITMKPYIKGQYYMITTIPLCDNYFLVVINSYHIVRNSLKRVAPVCCTKHVLVNYCNKESQASQVEL